MTQDMFDAIGIRPKGVLLHGPPGREELVGPRLCATRPTPTFLKLAGPQLVQMFIGDGAAYPRRLTRPRPRSKRGVSAGAILRDEIDAIGTKRFGGTSLVTAKSN
jgi:26S proteasome regulatory subunit T5